MNWYKNLSCLWASWSTDEDMEGQRQRLNVTIPREKLLNKQISTLALRCLYSNRVDIRLVDITAVQVRTAKKWRTQPTYIYSRGIQVNLHNIRDIYDSAEVHNPGPTKYEVKDDCDTEVCLQMSRFFELRCMMWGRQEPWHPPAPKRTFSSWAKEKTRKEVLSRKIKLGLL